MSAKEGVADISALLSPAALPTVIAASLDLSGNSRALVRNCASATRSHVTCAQPQLLPTAFHVQTVRSNTWDGKKRGHHRARHKLVKVHLLAGSRTLCAGWVGVVVPYSGSSPNEALGKAMIRSRRSSRSLSGITVPTTHRKGKKSLKRENSKKMPQLLTTKIK